MQYQLQLQEWQSGLRPYPAVNMSKGKALHWKGGGLLADKGWNLPEEPPLVFSIGWPWSFLGVDRWSTGWGRKIIMINDNKKWKLDANKSSPSRVRGPKFVASRCMRTPYARRAETRASRGMASGPIGRSTVTGARKGGGRLRKESRAQNADGTTLPSTNSPLGYPKTDKKMQHIVR